MRRAFVLLLATAAVLAKPDAEAALKAKVARVWVDYARWCHVQGLKPEAQKAVADARACDPAAKDLERLAADVEAMEGGGDDAPGLAGRREKARKDAAKLYDRLAKLDHDAADEARFEGYLLQAVQLDPSKARLGKLAAQVKQLAGNRKNADKAGRLLVLLREVDPDGKHDALEADLARKDVALIKGAHPMVGWLSLPDGWKKGGHYPVLVAVDGAGSGFLGRARNCAETRGNRPFIVLAPCSLSNTNQLEPAKYPFYTPEQLEEWNRDRITFDLEGLEALLAVVRERFGGEEKFAITGFSGGGNLCYAMTVRAPERILFSAPACANFAGLGFREAKPPADGGPPIRILTGEKDPHRDFTFGNKDSPGIEPQTDRAVQALADLGYTHVTRTMLPGVAHSPCPREVWDIADELAKG